MILGFSADRILHMQGILSKKEIWERTGLHWNTQNAVIRGTKFLDFEQKKLLQSAYGKLTYSEFRAQGMNVKQATRFRGLSPATVVKTELRFNKKIDELARHSITSKYRDLSAQQIKRKLDDELEIYKSGIRWSNYKSDAEFEYFLERGT